MFFYTCGVCGEPIANATELFCSGVHEFKPVHVNKRKCLKRASMEQLTMHLKLLRDMERRSGGKLRSVHKKRRRVKKAVLKLIT